MSEMEAQNNHRNGDSALPPLCIILASSSGGVLWLFSLLTVGPIILEARPGCNLPCLQAVRISAHVPCDPSCARIVRRSFEAIVCVSEPVVARQEMRAWLVWRAWVWRA